jgi:subfamily B ATP-binding cassette protein MsbA
VFDTQPEVRERPGAMRLPRLSGDIRFEGVSFGYGAGSPVLREVGLHMRAGEMIALVGPSGAGKTSLVQLIPRFFDPDAGRVTVDGYDLRDVTLRSLRSQIGIVAQDTVLLSGSVRENILYSLPDASDEVLRRVARAAHAEEFITRLPEGYDTLLGERGAKLSGGQRQRVAIARAFLRDPRILILDEATSALDSESEHLIQDALRQLMRGRTSVVIAHRLSTILDADRIVVMDQGRIVQVGSHAQLLAEGGLYGRLYERQFRTGPAPLSLVKPSPDQAAAAG